MTVVRFRNALVSSKLKMKFSKFSTFENSYSFIVKIQITGHDFQDYIID